MDDMCREFLIQLFEQTKGDASAQVSMYDIGDILSLDRDAASKAAAELIVLQLIEIRTLSGGIGITAGGVEEVQNLLGGPNSANGAISKLGAETILDATGRQSIETATADLKNRLSSLGVDFETLSELTADLKTIDAQLGSSRPKTAIIRACLQSLQTALTQSGNQEGLGQIQILLNE